MRVENIPKRWFEINIITIRVHSFRMLNVANVFHSEILKYHGHIVEEPAKEGGGEGEDKWTDENLLAIISFRDTFTVDTESFQPVSPRNLSIFDPDGKTVISESAPRESETRDFHRIFPSSS